MNIDNQSMLVLGFVVIAIILIVRFKGKRRGDKINLIVVDGKRMFYKKGNYDMNAGLVDVYRRGRIRSSKESSFDVNPEHLKNDPKGKLHLFIDSKTRQSFDVGSIRQIDEELRNKLDFLTERSFWYGLLASGYISLATRLIHICCGIGLYILIKTILITLTKGQVVLP